MLRSRDGDRNVDKPVDRNDSSAEPGTNLGGDGVSRRPTLIVGIGASAGGLNAYKTFLTSMPADSGMCFVLIQHLDPQHKSLLVELLGKHTKMTVAEAVDGVAVAANCVYVIPPDATLGIKGGVLRLETPAPARDRRRPIDSFFTSLAEDQGERAVCIVLSGSGSDGSLGLRAIKEHGGLCLAQSEFDVTAVSGMPDSAAATGLVDFELPIEAMPRKLIAYQSHLTDVAGSKDGDGSRQDMQQYLGTITKILRAKIGHEFGQYKDKTLIRRVQRRMQVLNAGTAPDYIQQLERNPNEVEALYRDLLIGVTQFFRDDEAFKALESSVISKLIEQAGRAPDNGIRIWVPGCATGEEAYSIAILFHEEMQRRELRTKIQIFGTDIDDKAVATARLGRYRKPIAGISPERLLRWFTDEGGEYRVSKEIRDTCIFTQHSVIKDPPFSKLDLISCRNLLIYMNAVLQNAILRAFHYGLRPAGFLFLGPSEGLARNTDLFDACDKKHRIFRRLDAPVQLPGFSTGPVAAAAHPVAPARIAHGDDPIDKVGRRIMEKYSPAYVIIDKDQTILRFSGGEIGQFLEPLAGAASLNLFRVLHKVLRPAVRAALEEIAKGSAPSVREDVAVQINGQAQIVTVIVEPIPPRVGEAGLCIVAFRHIEPFRGKSAASAGAIDVDVLALQEELHATRAQLLTAVEMQDTAMEEMRASNEEFQSVNEELQAANEELETAKEEMQSVNEELQTINSEMSTKNEMLTALNSDLSNILESSHIATIFLDTDLHIRNFTPSVEALFNVRRADIGRPLTDLVSKLQYADLERDVQNVMRTLTVVEAELDLSNGGQRFIMRIRPYITVNKTIDGVVITFVDITSIIGRARSVH